MNKFNETPEQEALLNSIIKSGKSWRQVRIDNAKLGADLDVTKEQFESRDGWIVWRGGEQPVGDGVMVDIIWPDGDVGRCFGSDIYWNDNRLNGTAYRLHIPEKEKPASRVFFEAAQEWDELLNGKLAPHKQKQPKGHPHAELYQELADIAKCIDTPWDEFQIRIKGKWHDCKDQTQLFHASKEYRRKPKTKLIHGVEVPDISFAPQHGEIFMLATPMYSSACVRTRMDFTHPDMNHIISNGLCYPDTREGKQAAILHAKAMLGVANE